MHERKIKKYILTYDLIVSYTKTKDGFIKNPITNILCDRYLGSAYRWNSITIVDTHKHD